MSEDLNPCPWCKKTPQLNTDVPMFASIKCMTKKCKISVYILQHGHDAKEKVIKIWNDMWFLQK